MKPRTFASGVALALLILFCSAASGQAPTQLSITTPTTLPQATPGVAYSVTFSATGGSAPYTWSLVAGLLPSGLSLSSAGVLSGTPTATCVCSPMIMVRDSAGVTAVSTFYLLSDDIAFVTTSPLPGGAVGVLYYQELSMAGQPPFEFSVTSGRLPYGLGYGSTSGQRKGMISGTPAESGTFNFTVTATDGFGRASRDFSLTIAANQLAIATTSPLPEAFASMAYSKALTVNAGAPPYTWSVISGSLPAGLSLADGNAAVNGRLYGTPTAAGAYSFTLQAKDSLGATATAPFALTVAPPFSIVTASPLPGATQGIAYSKAMSATGGTAPYAWSITGSLPTGLSLSTGGVVSGTPTNAPFSPATFTLIATDSLGGSVSSGFSLTVASPVYIHTTSPLPLGTVGAPYSTMLDGWYGTAPLTWSLASGALPSGLSLSSTGAISGTPTAAGSYSATIQLSDSNGSTARTTFSLTISSALRVTTSTLPNGTFGAPYSQTLIAGGGAPPYTWSLASGTLPNGLSLSSAGVVSGTPGVVGSSSFVVQVSDSQGSAARAGLSITVAGTLAITTASLTPGTVGVPYSETLNATGGAPPYTWTVDAPGLPAGLSLTAAGVISGSMASPCSSTVVVRVTDSVGSTTGNAFGVLFLNPLAITTTSPLPQVQYSYPYNVILAATGGDGGYTWSVTSGSLPTGLSLGSGQIWGNARQSGKFSFVLQVKDGHGNAASATFALTVLPQPPAITTTSVPDGKVGTAYQLTLSATGGTPPYSWSIASGALPGGLSLSSAGVISGTPTTAGSCFVTVQVSDSNAATSSMQFSLAITGALAITTASSLPQGSIGAAYSQAFSVAGGTSPYTWSAPSGAVPNGLSLSSGGVLSGTPLTTGSYSIVIQVSDASGNTARATCSLTIGGGTLATATSWLPNGVVGRAYSATLSATGGAPPYSWSVESGYPLPGGLSLSSAGVISGTPTTAGYYNPVMLVTDSNANTANCPCNALTIWGALAIATASPLPQGTVGAWYSQTLSATGGAGGYTWSVSSGALPNGLSLSTDGRISGTPAKAGAYSATIQVSDSASYTASVTFSLTVSATLAITTTSTLPAGAIGAPYSQTLSAAGGTPPYTWTAVAPGLPAGLLLAANGTISGTPASSCGPCAFSAGVTDSLGATVSATFTVSFTSGGLTISTSSLPSGATGVAYQQTLTAAGGASPYAWTLASGALPTGLTLSSAGVISGTPALPGGTYSFTAGVTDSRSATASATFSLTVDISLAVTTTSPSSSGAVGAAYGLSLSEIGGEAPIVWRIDSGALPDGLALSSAGLISGTPTRAGIFNFTVRVSDGLSRSASAALALTIAPASGCVSPLATAGQAFPAAGGNGSIAVAATAGCAWTASSSLGWVTLASGASGTGNGAVGVQAAPNSGAWRSGAITVAGQAFTIEQAAAATESAPLTGSLAQVASGGGWDTTLNVVNLGASPAEALIGLHDDGGSNPPLPFTFPQGPQQTAPTVGATLERTIPGNGLLVMDTQQLSGSGGQVGSAELQSTGAVSGFAIFQYAAGGWQAVVPLETRHASSYLLAFDYTNGLAAGLALANLGAQSASISVVVRDDSGAAIPTKIASIPLAANGHVSFMLNDADRGFPEVVGKRGTVEFDAPTGGQISVVGLRANGSSVTTLPILAQAGTGGGGLAQVATGGGWETGLTLVNAGAAPAQFTLSFADEKTGAALPLGLLFPQTCATAITASVTRTLAPGASALIQTQGGSATVSCSAQLATTGPVDGFAVFGYAPWGTEAVVPLESRTPNAFVLVYDNTGDLATGVAVANFGAAPVTVPVVVRDDAGAALLQSEMQLTGNGHASFMLTDETQGFPATAGRRGTVEFAPPSGARIGVLGLRANAAGAVTTIPTLAK